MHSKSKRNAASRRRQNNLAYSDLLLSNTDISRSSPPSESESDLPQPTHPHPQMTEDALADDLLFQDDGEDASRRIHLRVAGDPALSEGPVHVGSPSQTAEVHTQTEANTLQHPDLADGRIEGHVRSPVLTREPTTLEAFSRTIRNYVPSSIAIPSATPSPPRVSRPVSFGSFLNPSMDRDVNVQYLEKHRGSDVSRPTMQGVPTHKPAGDEGVFDLDEEVAQDRALGDGNIATRYPGVDRSEEILWAGWDILLDPSQKNTLRRMLILGYSNGLQMWDCSNLGTVSEVLNLAGSEWGAVSHAQIFPHPATTSDDEFMNQRPLLGVITRIREVSELLIYSLRVHKVVKRLPFDGLDSFQAAAEFVVVSTVQPPALHILSSRTFASLHTIPSTLLITSAHPPPSFVKNVSDVPSFQDLEQTRHDSPFIPGPVFALSGRLLAFASPLPSQRPSPSAPRTSRAPLNTPASDTVMRFGGLTMTQADIGNAAAKIGGSMLSGMKSLGGMAISAARAGVTAAMSTDDAAGSARRRSGAYQTSRSAPSDSSGAHEFSYPGRRRDSSTSQGDGDGAGVARKSRSPHSTARVAGCTVTVVDLRPLLLACSSSVRPPRVARFTILENQTVGNLRFSDDGTSIVVAMKDGQFARVFRISPRPGAALDPAEQETPQDEGKVSGYVASAQGRADTKQEESPVYTLRRGRTPAVVDGMDWLPDGRWFAMGTRKRTIHVYALNPFGGPVDEAGHMLGRVINAKELPPATTDMTPIVRVRMGWPQTREPPTASLAFTFIQSTDATLTSALLPSPTVFHSPSSSPGSAHSTIHSQSASPTQRPRRPTNFQDLLVFDPSDASLHLRRIFVEKSATDAGITLSSSVPVVGGTSISLPGMSTFGRLGTSPQSSNNSPGKTSALAQMIEKPSELTARESRVGTWQLGRSRDWPAVRHPLQQCSRLRQVERSSRSKDDLLSYAELSTCSPSPHILPRSLYLSHQFSFHAFGEDYHALIRSHHLDVATTKLEVRREVEVSAFSTGTGEFSVQGRSNARDNGGTSASFDEPIASALSAEITSVNPSPMVLPMLPNGTSGSNARSFKNSIPIRSVASGISDGMSESLVRLRRELGKVRSSRSVPRSGQSLPTSVPLEFDEEDEDFSVDALDPTVDVMSRSTSRAGESGASISTPSTNLDPLPMEEDGGSAWQGWGPEDQQAVEDAEQFDDISAVGFMDEEQESMREAEQKRIRKRRSRNH